MQILDDEGEDVFFDSNDCIRTSIDSSSSGDSASESQELDFAKLQYELWTKDLMSVQERRNRFLQGMGFDELAFSASAPVQEAEECVCCMPSENMDSERIMESSGAVSNSLLSADDEENRDSYRCIRDLDSGRTFMVHDVGQDGLLSMLKEVGSDRTMTLQEFEAFLGLSNPLRQFMSREPIISKGKQTLGVNTEKKRTRSWWRNFTWKRHGVGICKNDVSVKISKSTKSMRMNVQQHKKKCVEFTALYMAQEIKGHKGSIRTMKFSPAGWYLASGGEDCIVRVWQVREVETSSKYFSSSGSTKLVDEGKDGKTMMRRRSCNSAPVVIPKRIFKIEEAPIHEFHGHTGDILDLSWSHTDCLLTSSMDKTVRMWKVGYDACLNVFQHNDYVTSIQFNPVDERYFISGSIDGKVRIWGVSENRVLNWADVRQIVTAVCYQPDGKGFVVGTISGNCRFYDYTGSNMRLDRKLCVKGKKKAVGKNITCLQFSPNDPDKVMISSADSKVRIFDGADVIHKFRGLRRSKSQLSASFTSDGKYIISVDGDSHVYIWNYNESCLGSLKGAKTIRSCELFSSEGASLAVPWPGIDRRGASLGFNSVLASSSPQKILEPSIWLRDPDCFSLGVWFFADGSSRGSATWPEEKLILSSEPSKIGGHCHSHQQESHLLCPFHCLTTFSATWSLVILTASRDGSIRSFHNYGLPVRL